LTHRKQGKAFFFEKKKQKAFVCAVADLAGKVRVSTNKSFLVLFLEKGLLACYESWSRPAGIRQAALHGLQAFYGLAAGGAAGVGADAAAERRAGPFFQ
jgi:hypothetical protein